MHKLWGRSNRAYEWEVDPLTLHKEVRGGHCSMQLGRSEPSDESMDSLDLVGDQLVARYSISRVL